MEVGPDSVILKFGLRGTFGISNLRHWQSQVSFLVLLLHLAELLGHIVVDRLLLGGRLVHRVGVWSSIGVSYRGCRFGNRLLLVGVPLGAIGVGGNRLAI